MLPVDLLEDIPVHPISIPFRKKFCFSRSDEPEESWACKPLYEHLLLVSREATSQEQVNKKRQGETLDFPGNAHFLACHHPLDWNPPPWFPPEGGWMFLEAMAWIRFVQQSRS